MSFIEKIHGAAILLVISPQGIPFVRNKGPGRDLWRLPGGGIEWITVHIHGDPYLALETPEEAASRELREETGYIVRPEQIQSNGFTIQRNSHKRYLCTAYVERLMGTQLTRGDDDEEIKLFSVNEALHNSGFLISHRREIKPYLEREQSLNLSRLSAVG